MCVSNSYSVQLNLITKLLEYFHVNNALLTGYKKTYSYIINIHYTKTMVDGRNVQYEQLRMP